MTSTCPACRRVADLHPHPSVLDFQTRGLCWQCVESNAEPKDVVIASVAAGWDKVDGEIKRSITVFHRGDYISLSTWSARTRQCRDEAKSSRKFEDDLVLRAAVAKAREIYSTPAPPPRKRWFAWLSPSEWKTA